MAENKLKTYSPYTKQTEFHAAGKIYRERLFMAGNQLGKTIAGGAEAAMHATGLYPPDWAGRIFTTNTKGWVAGVTGESTRDNPQRVLMGEVGKFGTGSIPKSCIVGYSSARGVANLLDTVCVKHVTGEESIIAFKAYEKGREKWQGETLHWVWFDEEPPLDIYTEGLTRTNVHGGVTFITFTPLLGMSDTVMRFIGDAKAPDTHVTNMTIEDALHYTKEQRDKIIASYPAHEREARVKGVPMLGSGRIFPFAEEAVSCVPISIPAHWPQIGGMDFGYDHPFGAVKLAWDRDNDTVYVTKTYRVREEGPIIHSAAVKPWGAWLPWAWPHDGLQHDKGGSCEQLAEQYRKQGLNLLPERATFPDGTNGVEAGIMDMYQRFETARLKVFSTETEWFEEFRLYHRKDGKIVKERDDLMSATRYGIMMLRHAGIEKKAQPLKYGKLGTV